MKIRTLAQPNSRFAGDTGQPDPLTRSALAKIVDQVSYARAIVALCSSRLLLPVVASGDDAGEGPDPQRKAELAAVTIADQDGCYLLAFTGLDSLHAWNQQARPVPCLLDELAATVEPAGATKLLVDVAGPTPVVLEGEVLDRLADGQALIEFDDGFGWVSVAEHDKVALPRAAEFGHSAL